MLTLSIEESKKLLRAAKGNRFEALYYLALSTGMRQGELLGLRWRDIDLNERRLVVKHALVVSAEGGMLADPKTPGSRRRIELTNQAVEVLKRHKAMQAEERLSRGEVWEDHGLVFPNEIGKPVFPGHLIRRSFKPLLKKAKLPNIRFHDLRHSCATHLLSKNIHPKIVSEMLGHSSIKITLDTYSHVLPDMQKPVVETMERIYGSSF